MEVDDTNGNDADIADSWKGEGGLGAALGDLAGICLSRTVELDVRMFFI